MLGFQLIIALIIVLPLFFIHPQPIPKDFSFWIDMIIIAVVFTLLPLLLSMYALNSLPSSTVGIIIYINPVFAFGVAFFYFHESIQLNQILAYSLLIVAVIVFNWKMLLESFSKMIKTKSQIDIAP